MKLKIIDALKITFDKYYSNDNIRVNLLNEEPNKILSKDFIEIGLLKTYVCPLYKKLKTEKSEEIKKIFAELEFYRLNKYELFKIGSFESYGLNDMFYGFFENINAKTLNDKCNISKNYQDKLLKNYKSEYALDLRKYCLIKLFEHKKKKNIEERAIWVETFKNANSYLIPENVAENEEDVLTK